MSVDGPDKPHPEPPPTATLMGAMWAQVQVVPTREKEICVRKKNICTNLQTLSDIQF